MQAYLFSYIFWYLAVCSGGESSSTMSAGQPASRKAWTNFALPPARMEPSCFSDHPSIVSERTNEMCTPRLRCRPEHSRQKSVPYDTDAHCGWMAGQSTHLSLPGMDLMAIWS